MNGQDQGQRVELLSAMQGMGAWVAEVEKRFADLRRIADAAGIQGWTQAFVAVLHGIKTASAQAQLAAEQFVIASQALDVTIGGLVKHLGPEVVSKLIPEPPFKVVKMDDDSAEISRLN